MSPETEEKIIKPTFEHFLQIRLPKNLKMVRDEFDEGLHSHFLKKQNYDSLQYQILSNIGMGDYAGWEKIGMISAYTSPSVELYDSFDLEEHPTIARGVFGELAQEYADLSGKEVKVSFRKREEVEGESQDIIVKDIYKPSESG